MNRKHRPWPVTRNGSLAFFLLVFLELSTGCELSNDLSSLENGQCPAGRKPCVVDGKAQCVDLSDPSTGCSATNCASCDERVSNAVTVCSPTNQCAITACNAGYLNCNITAADGCETNILTDGQNCGNCGVMCGLVANGQPLCSQSNCTVDCFPGFDDCDKRYSTGCEVSLNTDAANCGACGHPCAVDQRCMGGQCM